MIIWGCTGLFGWASDVIPLGIDEVTDMGFMVGSFIGYQSDSIDISLNDISMGREE